jgi:hypothetical protein
MALFVGLICNNTENMPVGVSKTSHVRVRIPQFHGNKDNTTGDLYFADNQLPFARLYKPTDTEPVIATGYYEDGTVVLVEILNNDLTNLIITGTVGNYTYTTDNSVISARSAAVLAGSSTNVTNSLSYKTISDSLVQTALMEVGQTPAITDAGTNTVKYNEWFHGKNVSGESYNWDCVFICWLFDKCKLLHHFNGGTLEKNCKTLYKYHKNKGEIITSGYKSGDILFVNTSGGKSIERVDIAVTDFNKSSNTIECVGGDIPQKDSSGKNVGAVVKLTRKASQIIAAIRPGSAIYTNRNDPQWKQNDRRWANHTMINQTIGEVGCAMTSVAILLRMTGLTKTDFSPAVLNQYLIDNGGYTNSNCIYWANPNNYVDSWQYEHNKSGTLSGSNNDKINKIRELLDKGYYLVISVNDGGHWVAATGYSGNEILMSDPARKNTELFKTYSGVSSYKVFSCKNKFTMS